MEVDNTKDAVEESPEEEMEYTDPSKRAPLSSTSSVNTPLKSPPDGEFADKIVSQLITDIYRSVRLVCTFVTVTIGKGQIQKI